MGPFFNPALRPSHSSRKSTCLNHEFTEAIRIIDSTPIVLSGRGMDWADRNARTVGLKMHVMYDPELGCPLHFSFSSPRINDITEGKKIKIQSNGIYLFDRGYYDFGWWAQFTKARCTFVTRPKTTLKYKIVESFRRRDTL